MKNQTRFMVFVLFSFLALAVLGAAAGSRSRPAGPTDSASSSSAAIKSARIVTPPVNPIPSSGDLWMNTWADDNNLYTGWGDGLGPGSTTPFTDCGVGVLKGTVPYFSVESNSSNYVRSKFVPDGSSDRNDKPSSLLYIQGGLYFAGHSPLGNAKFGYIATSNDKGKTWTEVPNSPWTKAAGSPFRCLFFINMGKSYKLKRDGYIYAFGIGTEWAWLGKKVYLARVPIRSIADYSKYEYYTGLQAGAPVWSTSQSAAVPVQGLKSHQMFSAIYHEGIERFLALTIGNLYQAAEPWGPWSSAGSLFANGDDPEWKEGYMPGLIAKGAGADFVYFTLAGQSDVIRYYLHVGRIGFQLNSEIEAEAAADIESGRPPFTVHFRGSGRAGASKIVSYRWYFGDGTIAASQNPIHIFTAPVYGKYRTLLTVTDAKGRVGYDTIDITVPTCSLTQRIPEDPPQSRPGLAAAYYDLPSEGGVNIPDFSKLTPFKRDSVAQINFLNKGKAREGGCAFATSGRWDALAAEFKGFIAAPADGVYTFYLISDDASELRIGSTRVIDNSGEHAYQMRERAGQIALRAGRHAIRIGYTEIDKLNGLRLYWEGPTFARTLVPASALTR
jgi:hypothetical protein